MTARALTVVLSVSTLLLVAPSAEGGTTPAPVRIDATAAAPWLALGSSVGIRGGVSPHPAGMHVTLQDRQDGGWLTVETKAVRSDGSFSFAAQPDSAGVATYRVVASPGTNTVGASEKIPVRVLQWTYLADFYSHPGSGDLYSDPIAMSHVTYQHPVSIDAGCYNQWGGDAWVDYPLQGRFELLDLTVGLSDTSPAGSTATYTIIGDARKLATGSVTLGATTKVSVSTHGVHRLRLRINDPTNTAGCGTTFMQIVFGDAQVLGPAP